MGFLDPKERIQDVVLTQEGRQQLAEGRLEFAFFSVHDDEIDYEPVNYASASFDELDLATLRLRMIEDVPVMEAFHGKAREDVSNPDHMLVQRSFIFDSQALKSGLIPRVLSSPQVTSSLVQVDQATNVNAGSQTHTGVVRSARGSLDRKVSIVDGYGKTEGFVVKVYSTGSDGLTEIVPVYDSLNRRSYGLDLIVSVDDEPRPALVVPTQIVPRLS